MFNLLTCERCGSNFTSALIKFIWRIDILSSSCEIGLTETHWWQANNCEDIDGLGCQIITWANVDSDLCQHMVPQGHESFNNWLDTTCLILHQNNHYSDIIISAVASPITGVSIVYPTIWSNKTSKLRVTGLCEGNSPVTGEFPV